MSGPRLDFVNCCQGKKGYMRKTVCISLKFIISLIMAILLGIFTYKNPDI